MFIKRFFEILFLFVIFFNIAILRNVIYNMVEVIDLIRLKELRKEIKYTQRDVANYLGITQPAYANYENGSRQADYDTLNKLADLFNASVDYILGRTDDRQPSNSLDKQLEGIDFALWEEVHDLTDEEKKDIINFVKFTKSKRNQ